MTYELLIQHQGTIMLPPVVENVSLSGSAKDSRESSLPR